MAPFRMILTATAFAAALPAAALADDDDFPRYFHRDGIEWLLRGPDGWAYRGWWRDDDDRRTFRHRAWGDDDDDDRPRRRRGRDDDDDDDDD